ncbi:MAG: DUF255 domain-containing protein [Sandaracinaceae bacterium]
MRRSLMSVWLLGGLVACGGPSSALPSAASPRAASENTIVWQSFSPEVFQRAEREGRMVLVDVGIEGCTACRWMYEDTYTDPAVVARVNGHFVPVAVDADLRPDLGERWEAWGWPATIVLRAGGPRVFAAQGNKRPRTFLPMLDALIERHAAGTLEAELAIEEPPSETTPLGALCSTAVGRVRRAADPDGGYGRRLHSAQGGPVRWSFQRDQALASSTNSAHALRTLALYERMIDPVWGGIFVASLGDRLIPEKRIIHQGPVMAAFADAYQLTGASRWLEAALNLDRYLLEFMLAPDGTFYATQEDDAPNLSEGMDGLADVARDDEGRRARGIPPIDHGVYTDLNALVIEGYVRLYQATGDERHLARATRAAEALLARQEPAGWIAQTGPSHALAEDARMRAFESERRPYLEPQGPFGLSLLALYSATGEARWLASARRIAAGLALFEDPRGGAFFASPSDETTARIGQRVPYDENVSAARFLVRLSWFEHSDDLAAQAERVLSALRAGARLSRMGSAAHGFAQTVEELRYGPVDMTVVGDASDAGAQALFTAGQRVFSPRGIVRYEAGGVRYPDAETAVMYVCSHESCSSPLSDPAEVASVVERMSRVSETGHCPAP